MNIKMESWFKLFLIYFVAVFLSYSLVDYIWNFMLHGKGEVNPVLSFVFAFTFTLVLIIFKKKLEYRRK